MGFRIQIWAYRALKFGGGVDLDNISDEFEGHGHRSKAKVARLKNVIS